jgi:PPOX class probable F420-dependent enzyme
MASASDPLVQELLNGRFVATLGTVNPDGAPHMVSVWYLWDGGRLYVATSSRSRKARNMKERPQASLMIDARDPQASRGVTALCSARILAGVESQRLNLRIHRRYLSDAALADPRIGPVFAQWDDITLELTPTSFFAWDMREADRLVMGGAFAEHPEYLLPLER